MPKIEVLVTTEKVNPKALVVPAIGTERIKLRCDFIDGALVVAASDVVRSACDIEPGGRVWGNAFHKEIIELPGAIRTPKAWVAPVYDLTELIASRGDLPKAVETLRALIRVIELEKTEGSEIWNKAQKEKEAKLRNKGREERTLRLQLPSGKVLEAAERAKNINGVPMIGLTDFVKGARESEGPRKLRRTQVRNEVRKLPGVKEVKGVFMLPVADAAEMISEHGEHSGAIKMIEALIN